MDEWVFLEGINKEEVRGRVTILIEGLGKQQEIEENKEEKHREGWDHLSIKGEGE